MTQVTVDLADLQTLVLGTGVIKAIESAIASQKNDPFIPPRQEFTDAHNRLATEMRNASRAEAGTAVQWDGELDLQEVAFLRDVSQFEVTESWLFTISGTSRLSRPEIDRLMCKGMIQMGQLVEGVIWSGSDRPDIKPSTGFAVRMTSRGRDKLAKMDAQAAA